jgi:hypothetical protein
MTACGSGDKAESDGELLLTFDGDSCTYEGPTLLKAGPVTLIFFNESEGAAAVNLVRHTGDETIQDMIDTFEEEPSTGHAPSWTREIHSKGVPHGESHTWEGAMEPGIHSMVCIRLGPMGVWFGTGLTVVD